MNKAKKEFKERLLRRIQIFEGMIRQLQTLKDSQEYHLGFLKISDINESISDLVKIKNELELAIQKLYFMEQFKDAPWVIVENNGMPWYYQLLTIEKGIATLSRKGRTKVLNHKDVLKNFREATESEVLQHVEFLTRTNGKFISTPIPCDLSEVKGVIIDFAGGLFPPKPEPIVKKPKDADFYCITLKQGRGCTVYHESYDIAEKEAIRLSKQENKKAYVLGVVGVIEAKPTTTYDIKVNKF